MPTIIKVWNYLVKDKNGKVVIYQKPNFPLIAWAALALATLMLEGEWRDGVKKLATAFIFLWAYLEITQGSSRVRRLIGLVVMIAIVSSFFVKGGING